jgi:flagellar assembly protein FliH
MSKILKDADARLRNITAYGRGELDEFPEIKPPEAPGIELEDVGEEKIDLEALRQAVLAEAKDEASRKVEEAYAEGLRRGEEAGLKQFNDSIAQATQVLESAAEALERVQTDFVASLQPQVTELAILIARRVLQREIHTDADLVRDTAARALAKLANSQAVTLRVNPKDLTALKTHTVRLLDEFQSIEELNVEADELVTPGGCIADTNTLQIDARLETLLDNLLGAMME